MICIDKLFAYDGQRGRGMTHFSDLRSGDTQTWDNIDKSVFLLGGFALENAIKAFLVYENPHWISNGRLSRSLRSHSLTGLQRQSAQIPFKSRYAWVLRGFEEGLKLVGEVSVQPVRRDFD